MADIANALGVPLALLIGETEHDGMSKSLPDRNTAPPRLFVVGKDRVPECFEVIRPWVFVGRGSDCHIALSGDASIGRLHSVLALVRGELTVIDRNATNGTQVNGARVAQRHLLNGDIIRMGDAWMIVALRDAGEHRVIHETGFLPQGSGTKATTPRSPRLDRGSSRAIVQVVADKRISVQSDSRPVLLGSDPLCSLRLKGAGVARFHAIVYWDVMPERGVYFDDLNSGYGVLRNETPMRQAQLADGDILQIGEHRVAVSFSGDMRARAHDVCARLPQANGLAITCVEGRGIGVHRRLLPEAGPVVLGRADDCGLVLHDGSISGRHARVVLEKRQSRVICTIEDLGSTNGTAVNGRQLSRGERREIGPGDVIRLNSADHGCYLLVHYDI